MHKRLTGIFVLCLLGISLVMVSCSESSKTTTATELQTASTAGNTTVPNVTTQPSSTNISTISSTYSTTLSSTSESSSEEDYAALISAGQQIPTMQYTMVVPTPNQTQISTKVWMKNPKIRMEMNSNGIDTIMLIDTSDKTLITYIPSQNMAMQMDYSQAESSVIGQADSVAQYNPVLIGVDTIDSETCLVYEYSVNGNNAKIWVWKNRGLPLRVETVNTDGKNTIAFENYDFSDIAESMFELPAGVQVSNMGSIPTGIPGNLPTEIPGNIP